MYIYYYLLGGVLKTGKPNLKYMSFKVDGNNFSRGVLFNISLGLIININVKHLIMNI